MLFDFASGLASHRPWLRLRRALSVLRLEDAYCLIDAQRLPSPAPLTAGKGSCCWHLLFKCLYSALRRSHARRPLKPRLCLLGRERPLFLLAFLNRLVLKTDSASFVQRVFWLKRNPPRRGTSRQRRASDLRRGVRTPTQSRERLLCWRRLSLRRRLPRDAFPDSHFHPPFSSPTDARTRRRPSTLKFSHTSQAWLSDKLPTRRGGTE